MRRLDPAAAVLLLLASCAALPEPSAASDSAGPASSSGAGSDSPAAASASPLAGPASAVAFSPAPALPADYSVPASIGASAGPVRAWSSGIPLSAAFADAYREALLRGVPLRGPLGGDAVHPWTAPGGSAWAQNWRDDGKAANSWGLPGLVVAAVPSAGGRVCVVRGKLLDAYGSGGGAAGANGVAGYGAPLGDEYPAGDGTAAGLGIAQRFELGLLSVSAEGRVSFSPGPPPSAAGVPEGVGEGAPASGPVAFPATGRTAFWEGWKAAADSGLAPAAPDGPVEAVSGLFVQTFGGGAWALALPVGNEFPYGLRARRLSGPFLARYLAAGGWAGGAAAFGPPLADPSLRGGGLEQRFLKGTMSIPTTRIGPW
jgi:hypothetical protein